MTDTTAQEPTMEEILASIRRIISEDDAPAAEAAPAAAESPPENEPAPMPDPEPEPAEAVKEEAILELTDRYEPPVVESIGDLDISAAEDPEPEPFPTALQPEPRPAYAEPAPSETSAPVESLVGASAASAFAGLSASLARPEPAALAGGSGPTIDALARELLRPMLKEWLDENLPGIVEAAVRKEVERIARSAG